MIGSSVSRHDALLALARMREPLGPLREPADAEAYEQAWADAAGEAAIDAMLDLLVRPPSAEELDGVAPDAFEYEISRALTLLGTRHPQALRARGGALIDHSGVRPTLIEVIGALGDGAGLALLRPLVRDESLSEEEVLRLACALGEIGEADAETLLVALRAHPRAANPRVRDEIETAASQMRTIRKGRHSPR
jgi:hypothetical protein